jgi:hypothetical protein
MKIPHINSKDLTNVKEIGDGGQAEIMEVEYNKKIFIK